MTLTPGSRVAFVGTSGCGKSTLSKLISGLYNPWEGEILFDGKHRNEIPRSIMTGPPAFIDPDKMDSPDRCISAGGVLKGYENEKNCCLT